MKILVINKTNASHTTNKQWKFDTKQHPTLGALPHLPPGVYIAMQVRGYIIKIPNIIIIINNSGTSLACQQSVAMPSDRSFSSTEVTLKVSETL